MEARANQPVHWFLEGKGLTSNKEQVFGLVRPNHIMDTPSVFCLISVVTIWRYMLLEHFTESIMF